MHSNRLSVNMHAVSSHKCIGIKQSEDDKIAFCHRLFNCYASHWRIWMEEGGGGQTRPCPICNSNSIFLVHRSKNGHFFFLLFVVACLKSVSFLFYKIKRLLCFFLLLTQFKDLNVDYIIYDGVLFSS